MSRHVKLTSGEWADVFDVEVLDPDGWRRGDGVFWDTPITKDDFVYRVALSTVRNLRKDFFERPFPPTKTGSFIIANGVGEKADTPVVPLFLTLKGWMNMWGLEAQVSGWDINTIQDRGFTVVYDAGEKND
jgi:hypothetical protein